MRRFADSLDSCCPGYSLTLCIIEYSGFWNQSETKEFERLKIRTSTHFPTFINKTLSANIQVWQMIYFYLQ